MLLISLKMKINGGLIIGELNLGQGDILELLEKNKQKWHSIKELCELLNATTSTTACVAKLRKNKLVLSKMSSCLGKNKKAKYHRILIKHKEEGEKI